jgi:hypothetical protein
MARRAGSNAGPSDFKGSSMQGFAQNFKGIRNRKIGNDQWTLLIKYPTFAIYSLKYGKGS